MLPFFLCGPLDTASNAFQIILNSKHTQSWSSPMHMEGQQGPQTFRGLPYSQRLFMYLILCEHIFITCKYKYFIKDSTFNSHVEMYFFFLLKDLYLFK